MIDGQMTQVSSRLSVDQLKVMADRGRIKLKVSDLLTGDVADICLSHVTS